jgi:N-acyl-L-homoserine lactone synthetase
MKNGSIKGAIKRTSAGCSARERAELPPRIRTAAVFAELRQLETQNRRNIASADECIVLVADTPELVSEVFRLRYQVYCVERGYEPGYDGMESDEFDTDARHVLLIHRTSGEPVGTVRIVPSSPISGLRGLPMTAVCAPSVMRDLPPRTTGEISRFALSKQRRMSCRAGSMVRLGLMQGVVRLSGELGLTDWCAIMEPMLLRLLQMNAIHFAPLGPLVEHHGLRQPSYGNIARVLAQMRAQQWDVWNYVTLGGTLWRAPVREALKVA